MKGFVGFMDPKVEAQALKIAKESAGEKRKDREQTRKDFATYGKKDVTTAQHRQLRNDARKRYKSKFENVLGEIKEDAPDEKEWIEQDVQKELKAMGTGGVAKGAAAGEAISEKAEGEAKRYKDPKTGNTLIVHPGGKREVLDPSGKVLATRGGKEPAKTKDYGQWDEAISAVAAEKEKAEKVPEKAKRKATARGSATYTDPKTGKKMKAVMNADGTITTEEVEAKKKKRKEGYGEKGYKPRSINK